ATLPNFILPADVSASNRYYKKDITNESFVLNSDSTINVPTNAGLGVTVDKDALQSYTISKIEC
ncbi:MAG TPA: hypothetical protein PLX90_10155, partial [Anaerolineales bacterium]|nr:hypothetical protein [Anaerolineales bacterium]